jgi:hypothetical protein
MSENFTITPMQDYRVRPFRIRLSSIQGLVYVHRRFGLFLAVSYSRCDGRLTAGIRYRDISA